MPRIFKRRKDKGDTNGKKQSSEPKEKSKKTEEWEIVIKNIKNAIDLSKCNEIRSVKKPTGLKNLGSGISAVYGILYGPYEEYIKNSDNIDKYTSLGKHLELTLCFCHSLVTGERNVIKPLDVAAFSTKIQDKSCDITKRNNAYDLYDDEIKKIPKELKNLLYVNKLKKFVSNIRISIYNLENK